MGSSGLYLTTLSAQSFDRLRGSSPLPARNIVARCRDTPPRPAIMWDDDQYALLLSPQCPATWDLPGLPATAPRDANVQRLRDLLHVADDAWSTLVLRWECHTRGLVVGPHFLDNFAIVTRGPSTNGDIASTYFC